MADTFSFRFSTKYFDADCDLYYYGFRHYKPQIMRWLTEDPIGEEGGVNQYLFCDNLGIYMVDIDGRWPWTPNWTEQTARQAVEGKISEMRKNGYNFAADAGYALNGVRQSTLAYDPATGLLATMLANGSDTPFTWNYLAGSNLKSSLAYPNGLTASWQYDANNQLLQVKNAFPTNVISQYDYTYDAAGRRVTITRSGSAMSETRTDEYGYNIRGELISAAKNAEAAKVIEYQYAYDDIGNRLISLDLGTNRTYTANNLNQYTQISNLCDSASLREEFIPQFDDDGNQTLIKTATGIWQVQYNGENRPIRWQCVSTNTLTPHSLTYLHVLRSHGAESC